MVATIQAGAVVALDVGASQHQTGTIGPAEPGLGCGSITHTPAEIEAHRGQLFLARKVGELGNPVLDNGDTLR